MAAMAGEKSKVTQNKFSEANRQGKMKRNKKLHDFALYKHSH